MVDSFQEVFWLRPRVNKNAGRMRNPVPGKLFYCQDQVGEKAKVGLGQGDFFLSDWTWVIGGGERGV